MPETVSGRADVPAAAVARVLARVAVIGLALFAAYRLRGIITALIVAAIIAYILDPAVEWLCHRPTFVAFHRAIASWLRALGTSRAWRAHSERALSGHGVRTLATIYVFVAAALVAWQGSVFVASPFVSEFRVATSHRSIRQLLNQRDQIVAWYDQHAPAWARSERIVDQVHKAKVSDYIGARAAEFGRGVLDSLKNLVEILLLPVLAFYFLIDGRRLKHEFIGLLPRGRRRAAMQVVADFNRIMRAFIVGQFILCILAGAVVGIGLSLLHLRFAIVLGVLAGVTRAIPIIGPIVGGIPIVLIALITKGLPVGLAVLVFFTVLHFAESKFVMPILIGDRIDLHPILIIVGIIAGGEAGGLLIGGQLGALLGMFFAAPIAAVARVMLRRYWLRIPDRPTGVSARKRPAGAMDRPAAGVIGRIRRAAARSSGTAPPSTGP